MQTQSSRNPELASAELFLRIQHPHRDPDEITQILGIEPEHLIRAGVGRERDGVRRLHAQSYWLAALPVPTIGDLQDGYQSAALHEQAPTLTREDLPLLRGATEYDVFIILWLKRFEAQREFFRSVNRDGGAATFLIERQNANGAMALRTSLGRLAEFGIGVELG